MRTASLPLASAILSAAALFGCATGVHAQPASGAGTSGGLVVHAQSAEPVLNVTATGRALLPADEVTIVLSVVTESMGVDDAVRDNNQRSRAVADALNRLQLGDNAVTTSGFRVTPQYRHDRNTGRQIGVSGYNVTNTVQVKTSKVDQAGKIVEAGINAGANEVLSLNFGLRDTKAARSIAVKDAVKTARADADAAADAAELRIGAVKTLSIQPNYNQPMYRMAERSAMVADAGGVGETPTNPGLIEVTATVTVEYRIEPR